MSSRYIFKKKALENYTVIANTLINDKSLSWQARGLLMYLLSKPDDWSVTKTDLSNQSPAGGDAVATILKELETKCYISREKTQNELGRWEWKTLVFDEPYTIPPSSMHGDRGNILNTDKPNTTTKPTILDAMLKYNKQEKNSLEGYPPDVVDLLQEYIRVSNCQPVASEKSDWIKTARQWLEYGIAVEDVVAMYRYALERWDVARPGSITKAYRMMKSRQHAEQKEDQHKYRKGR